MGRGEVGEILVRPPVVVALEPFMKPPPQFEDRGVFLEVDFLVFDAPPKPLDEDVVHPSPAAIHADLHAEFQQAPGPFR